MNSSTWLSTTKIIFILFFIIQTTNNPFTLNSRYTIHILSKLTPESSPSKVHCQSEDDDLGIWTLNTGEGFDFSFHATGDTLFHCCFVWGSKHNHFDVFSNHNDNCNIVDFKNEYCNYVMEADGFYFAIGSNPQSSDFKLIAPWYSWVFWRKKIKCILDFLLQLINIIRVQSLRYLIKVVGKK